MCAGTVVEPPGETSAAIFSVTSRSRSVALNDSAALSALIRTLARIGIVLRRSTTRCTWPRDFRSCARSTVIFMAGSAPGPALAPGGKRNWRAQADSARARAPTGGAYPVSLRGRMLVEPRLFLQLALQEFDFLGQRRIIVDEVFDFSHRVQDRGVVAAAEAPAY